MHPSHIYPVSFQSLILGAILLSCTGCSEKKKARQSEDGIDSAPTHIPAPTAIGAKSHSKAVQFSVDPKQRTLLNSVQQAITRVKSANNTLDALNSEWTKASHPSFKREATTSELRQALETDPGALLTLLRSPSLEEGLKTALITRVSLLTGFLGESENQKTQVLRVFREMIERKFLRQEDIYNLQIMQLAVRTNSKRVAISDDDFQEWIRFAKSNNSAAKAIAVVSFSVLDANESQRSSFYQIFASETDPTLIPLMARHLKTRSSKEATDALRTMQLKLSEEHATFPDN